MRLNLGCGWVPLEGYVNVDAHCPADVQGDIRELDFSDVEEVRMDHLLEHLPHAETVQVLKRVRSWMRLGAPIAVEVPDMAAIMENPRGTWLTDIYGTQSHQGEFHMSGFDVHSLSHALFAAGFSDVTARAFVSDNLQREGLPCVEAIGRA